MEVGKLQFEPEGLPFELVAEPTGETVQALELRSVYASEIDETLAYTAAFCEHYMSVWMYRLIV